MIRDEDITYARAVTWYWVRDPECQGMWFVFLGNPAIMEPISATLPHMVQLLNRPLDPGDVAKVHFR